MTLISSRTNPKVKLARSLRQRKARQESGLFLVEGIRHVGEAVQAGMRIESLFYAPELLQSEFAQDMVEELRERGVACLALTPEVFGSLADKDNPQGILAVVHQASLSLAELTPKEFTWGVAVVDPQDPGNLGTILRSIDAVGASGLLLIDSSLDAYHPGAVRASMGSLFWKPVVHASFEDFRRWARQYGYTIYGTSAHASLDFRKVNPYRWPCILLMGSERSGLGDEQRAACDELVRLPMLGRATSLNLGVATGVMLYAMLENRPPEFD